LRGTSSVGSVPIDSQFQTREASDQDRDHSAAAALSSLARIPTPTLSLTTSVNKTYQPSDASSPTGDVDTNDHETYEWDEGGDEKELGTDAMGTASTRDHKTGFFGMSNLDIS
jgi:hypothetical protein